MGPQGSGGPGTLCTGSASTPTESCTFEQMPIYSQTNPNLAYVNRPAWLYNLQPTSNPPQGDIYSQSYLPLGPIPGDPGSIGYWLTALCGPTSGSMVLMAQLNGRSDDVLVKGWTADAFIDGVPPADQPNAMPSPLVQDNHYSPAITNGSPLMSGADIQRIINYTYMQKGWGGGGSMVENVPQDVVHAPASVLSFFPDHSMSTQALHAISQNPARLQALAQAVGADPSKPSPQLLADIQSKVAAMPTAADGGHGNTISRAQLASYVRSGYGLVLAVNDWIAHVSTDSSGNRTVSFTGGGQYGHILALHSFRAPLTAARSSRSSTRCTPRAKATRCASWTRARPARAASSCSSRSPTATTA